MSSKSSMLTPTHKYAAGALFGLALHQAQIHQTCPLGFPSDDASSEERVSSSSSTDSVSDDPQLWAHESSGLLRPIFKFLEIDNQAWSGLEETAGSSPPKHHVGAFLRLLSEESDDDSSEADMELALANGVDAMSSSMEKTSDHESNKEKRREYKQECQEKLSITDAKSKSNKDNTNLEKKIQNRSIAASGEKDAEEEKLLISDVKSTLDKENLNLENNQEKIQKPSIPMPDDEKPVEEVKMLRYSRKLAVLYELLSACLAPAPEDGKRPVRRRKGYDARHRVALRLLATWLDVKWIKMDRDTGRTIGTGRESNGLYYLTPASSNIACPSTDSHELLHCRLGHPSLSKLQKMVIFELGGVARNVADCISKLEARPFMISAVGKDMAGNLLLQHWESAGLSLEGIQRHRDIETAVVCYIFDENGEVAAGVACVESIEEFLTPRWIENFKCNIRSAPILMVDANLSSSSLEACCKMAAQFNTAVWFEPVSVAKSRRVASVAQYVSFTSPNEDELIAMANALSGRDIFSPIQRDHSSIGSLFKKLKPAILVLLDKGVKVVVVTVGSDGVFLCSKAKSDLQKLDFRGNQPPYLSKQLNEAVSTVCPRDRFFGASSMCGHISNLFAVHFPALCASVVRLTGAGDCLVGGTIASLCAGLDVMQSLAVGIAAAKVAVEVESNVPSKYCLARVAGDARSVYSGATVLLCQSKL